MKPELEKALKAMRKNKREIADLNALRDKISKHVKPDKAMLEQIDAEITRLSQ